MYFAYKWTVVACFCTFQILFAGVEAAPIEAQDLRLVRAALTLSESNTGEPVAVGAFRLQDHIFYLTEIAWFDSKQAAGSHHLEYKFFSGDKQIFAFEGQKEFAKTPYTWTAWVSGSHLGEGHHRAELWIDGKKMDAQELDISAGAANHTSLTSTKLEHQDDLAIRDAIRQQAGELLTQGRAEEFERLAIRFRTNKERSPAGFWKLGVLYDGIHLAIPDKADSPQWATLDEMAKRWLSQKPDSAVAVIVSAQLKLLRAWKYRGDDLAVNVSPENRARFSEYVGQARLLLEQHQANGEQDPEWAKLRVQVASWQQEPASTILEIADAALKREPAYYPLHYAVATAMQPKWGGSEALIKQYVQLALERSKTAEGTQVYARIYFNLMRKATDPLDTMNMSAAKWPATRQSLDEILKAYPDDWNIDTAQAFSCLAGVPDYYRSFGRWAQRHSSSISWFDTVEYRQNCDASLFDGKQFESSITSRVKTYISYLRGFGENAWLSISLLIIAIFIALEWALRFLKPSLNRVSVRNAVRTTVYGSAIFVMIALVPSPPTTETIAIQGVCVLLFLGGLATIIYPFLRRKDSPPKTD